MRSLPLLRTALLVVSLGGLAGCDAIDPAALPSDTRIALVPHGDGIAAVGPECPPWTGPERPALRNDPWPQFGCATRRNLAAQVARPEDLRTGRPSGPANGTQTSNAMERYRAGKTIPLIDPNAEAPAQQSAGAVPGATP